MKKGLQKILSISLALIVFFSTMSFTVVSNYCADDLVDYSFFDNASWCNEIPGDSFTKTCEISDVPCCSSDILIVKGKDDLQQASFQSLTFDHQLFIATFTYSYLSLFEDVDDQITPFANYTPPLVGHGIFFCLTRPFLI